MQEQLETEILALILDFACDLDRATQLGEALDSLQIIELVSGLEARFAIEVTDDDLLDQDAWLQTVASVASFIRAKQDRSQHLTAVVAVQS